VRSGLITVQRALKTLRGFEPEKIFYVLPANITILGTIATAFSLVKKLQCFSRPLCRALCFRSQLLSDTFCRLPVS
jgi:hypothetical protein